MLGFAMRAGKVLIGTDIVCRSIPARVELVLIAADASEGTKDKVIRRCDHHKAKYIILPLSCDELGHLLGKSFSPAAAAITDKGFAEQIAKAVSSPEGREEQT